MILPTVSMQRFVTDGRKDGWMDGHTTTAFTALA